jgi:hypothetical protein
MLSFLGLSPRPEVAAVLPAVGWINDMYTHTRDTGIYGLPGQLIQVGDARAVVLPDPTPLSPVDKLLKAWSLFAEHILFDWAASTVPVSGQ